MMRLARLGWSWRSLAVAVSIGLLLSSSGLPVVWAQQTGTIQGGLLDPQGRPAAGFKAVFKDVTSGKELMSAPSGSDGSYSLQVPVGTRYLLVGAIAPDGTRIPVQQIAPLPVRVPGTYRLDVQFKPTAIAQQPPPGAPQPPAKPPATAPKPPAQPPAQPPVVAQKPPEKEPEKRKAVAVKRVEAEKPWWKTAGGIVGIVVGIGAVAAAASSGGGDSESPGNP